MGCVPRGMATYLLCVACEPQGINCTCVPVVWLHSYTWCSLCPPDYVCIATWCSLCPFELWLHSSVGGGGGSILYIRVEWFLRRNNGHSGTRQVVTNCYGTPFPKYIFEVLGAGSWKFWLKPLNGPLKKMFWNFDFFKIKMKRHQT